MKRTVGLMAALAVVAAGCSSSSGDDGSGDGFMAEVMCEEFVKDKLKSPSSAEFSDAEHVESAYGWRVTGVVDSENSFGAMLRADYECELKNTGGDQWRAKSVDLLPR